jgi:amidase
MAVTGPIARSSADLRAALNLIIGPREGEEIGWTVSLPACSKRSLSQFRVAMLLESEVSRVGREVREALSALAEWLRSMGAVVSIGTFPDFDPDLSHATFTALMHAGFAGAIPDGAFEAAEAAARSLEASDHSRQAIYLRNVNMTHRAWIKHDLARGQLQAAWRRFFRSHDLFLCPCAATAATPHDKGKSDEERTILVDGQPVPAIEQYFWAGLASVAGLPVTTAPIGLSPTGLPIGVQIIGPRFGDETCLAFAGLLEAGYRAFVPPPGYA